MDSATPGPSGERPRKRKKGSSTLEQTTENQPRTGEKIDRSLSDLQDRLLRVLECPICTEIMKSPIYQCSSGHSICSNCISQVTLCPFCQISVKNPVRNFSLEEMSEQLPTPCSNKQHGCQETVHGKQDSHEKHCPYRQYDCPISQDMNTDCSWKGLRKNMLEHVMDNHPQALFTTNNYSSKFASNNDYGHYVALLQLQDDLFVSYFHYEKGVEKFWLAVQYLGPSENASKFAYQIKLTVPDKCREISYTRKVHSENEDIQTVFRTDDCFIIIEQQTKLFKIPNEENKWYNNWSIIRL